MTHQQTSRRPSRRPSFILVDKDEVDEITSSSVIGNMGIPALYIVAGATTLIGIICMAIISKYWAEIVQPPSCFLYSQTPSSAFMPYHFGSSVTCCYWVAYGCIPALLICIVCGILYVMHVKDDKDVTIITYGCVIAVFIGTINMLAVTCTLSQGLRITCTNIMLNPSHSRGRSCKEIIDAQMKGFTLPIQTSSMITASLANFWISTFCFMLITVFHIALLVRRTSAY